MEIEVAMTYARALYDAAEDLGHVEEVQEEIIALDKIFREEHGLRAVMHNPAFSRSQKKETMRTIFEGRVHEEVVKFLCILIDKNRYYDFHGIVREYRRIWDEEQGIGFGMIYSAVPLTEEQIHKFEGQAEKLLRKKIELHNRVDTSLIGGVRLFIDGKLIDASISKKLERMAETIRNS